MAVFVVMIVCLSYALETAFFFFFFLLVQTQSIYQMAQTGHKLATVLRTQWT